jgi:hypothetical protein
MAQLALHAETIHDPDTMDLVEEFETVLALLFCPVHREVGIPEQLLGAVARVRWKDYADARSDAQLGSAYVKWHRQLCRETSRDLMRLALIGEVDAKNRELVTRQAGRRVRLPEDAPQPVRHLDQQRVAGFMTEGVVHKLEVVKTETEDG